MLLLGAGAAGPLAAQTYQLVDLGVGVAPTDINNDGLVAGFRRNADQSTTGIIYFPDTGLIEDIPDTVAAYGINGIAQVSGNTALGAFLYSGGDAVDLGNGYGANRISDTGLVAGTKTGVNRFRPTPLPLNPAIYDQTLQQWKVLDVAGVYSRGQQKGVYADLYRLVDVNDRGFAVGSKSRYGLYGSSAILITPAFLDVTYLPIPFGGFASAINNQNLVACTSYSNTQTGDYSHAYVYDFDAAILTDLGTLGQGLTSTAKDINDNNQVVGNSWLATSLTSVSDPMLYHAFLWEADQMTDLNDLVDPASGWLLTDAIAINDNGDIVGTALVNGETHGYLLAADPQVQPPVAIAAADVQWGRAPLGVNLTARDSFDPDGSVVAYAWSFGDGTYSTEINPSHTYTAAGRYRVRLEITDNDGLTNATELAIRVFMPRP